jgi:flagellar basal-body rod modification protein FlgD
MVMSASSINSNVTNLPEESSKAAGRQTELNKDRDNFLKLLMAQLKNQNPLSPTDTTAFTQQIIGLTQAEQSITTNQHLEKMVEMNKAAHIGNLTGYIDKEVEYDGSRQKLARGSAEFGYILEEDAQDVNISIMNSSGKTILTTKGEPGKGSHEFIWNGKDNSNRLQDDGNYIMEISAKGKDNRIISVITNRLGHVMGVSNANGKSELILSGGKTIDVNKVIAIKQSDVKPGQDNRQAEILAANEQEENI